MDLISAARSSGFMLPSQPVLWKLALTLVAALPLAKWYLDFRNARNKTGHIPGTLFFSELPILKYLLGLFAPKLVAGEFWCPNFLYVLEYKYTAYKNFNTRMISRTSLFGKTTVMTNDPKTFRYVLSREDEFPKAQDYVYFANFMGDNILGNAGDAWKLHRRIVAPVFNQDMYQHVWSTTVDLYKEIVEKEKWADSDSVLIQDASELTHKVTFFNVAVCLFGDTAKWDVPFRYEDGRLSMFGMIRGVSKNVLLRLFTPRWAYFLGSKQLKEVDQAYNAFKSYVNERVRQRGEQIADMKKHNEDVDSEKTDVLGVLVRALTRNNEEKLTMSESDVMGNMFLFSFSGHETTAQNICVTMAFLGLFPEVQEKVYTQIKSQIQDREPSYSDYPSLHIVLACLFESLRRFPPAPFIPRIASRDAMVPVSRRDNPAVVEKVFIKEGTNIFIDLLGHGVDPDFFPNPDEFNPFRWDEDNITEEHMLALGYGSRECLGRKFSYTESVAFLTCVMLDWKIEVSFLPGESKEQWQKRVFKPKMSNTLVMDNIPVRLVRRRE